MARLNELTDEQAESLAAVSPADVEEAKAAWRQDAPRVAKELLEAETEESLAE